MKQLLFALALAACGSKGAGPTTAPLPPTTAPATTTLELGEVTVYDGSDAMVKIHANGNTEMGGQSNGAVTYKAGPVLAADGTATYEGKPVAKLNADGTVMDLTTNKIVPITVTADKLTISGGGQTASIVLNADGTMTVPNGGSKAAPRVEGADTAGKRRAVLLMVGLLMGGSDDKPADSGPATAPATKP
jgi:hypothetical protein